jgi:hypothetical protein
MTLLVFINHFEVKEIFTVSSYRKFATNTLLAGLTSASLLLPAFAAEPVLLSQNLPPLNDNSSNSSFYTPGNNGNGSFTSYGQNNGNYGQNNGYNQNTSYGNNNAYGNSSIQGYVATAPAGTTITATLSNPLSSEFARVGARFTANLNSPLAANGSVLLPAGSQVEGQVVMVKAAGRTGRNGELEVRFNSAILPNGQRLPLMAHLQTADNSGILKGGTGGGRFGRAAMSTGIGGGLGAALGTAMGPLSGGGVGRGAIFGTALGAGAGALGAAWQKGKPAVLDSSQPLSIVLDQPLTASPSQDSGGYNNNGNQQQYNGNY